MLLRPRNGWAEVHSKPLKLNIGDGKTLKYYQCSRRCKTDDGSRFLISDELEVIPVSTAARLRLLSKFEVMAESIKNSALCSVVQDCPPALMVPFKEKADPSDQLEKKESLTIEVTPTVFKIRDPKSSNGKEAKVGGFVKGPAMFVVTDNLKVKPIANVSPLSMLTTLQVPFSDAESLDVLMGKKEVTKLYSIFLLSLSFMSN
ncbi:hypothetical protein Tsubulata_012622 [Turnera subulata]|uniref:Uncharacterized protein n=1 Tax=Turnera subulata TaxID=218843 RepID=A0A9Q0FMF9_9ROSI|nr:hypothetical protein Tsubulata_012622 [Turnera subulata]